LEKTDLSTFNIFNYSTEDDYFDWAVDDTKYFGDFYEYTSSPSNNLLTVDLLDRSSFGCETELSKNIDLTIPVDFTEKYVKIPTAFTPNGDGLHDRLVFTFTENIKSFYFELYNRWGQQIKAISSLDVGWDGRLNSGMIKMALSLCCQG
jgi:gliding motility-associated-like protein